MLALDSFCFLPSAFVEDDPYGELVYVPGADTTSIHSRDRDGRVLYLGTFSKILAPGMRCGWIAAAKELIERFEIAKQAADLCSGMLDQSIVDEYCNAGELPAQIAARSEWTSADGGLFTFLTFRDDIDTAAHVEQSVKNGVAYVPGAPFFVDGSGRNTMRLTFAKEPDDRIREGISRLAAVIA